MDRRWDADAHWLGRGCLAPLALKALVPAVSMRWCFDKPAEPHEPLVRSPFPTLARMGSSHVYRGIVSYLAGYKAEATQAHAAGIKYFLGETNSGA